MIVLNTTQIIFFFLYVRRMGRWTVPRVKGKNPLSRKRLFLWISMKSRHTRTARETSKYLPKSRLRYMAKILPIRRKTKNNHFFGSAVKWLK